MSNLQPNPKNKRSRSILSEMFNWLGAVMGDQTKTNRRDLADMRQISHYRKEKDEIKEHGRAIVENLKGSKTRLNEEFGQSAACFISKCIDPMICQIIEVMESVEGSDHKDTDSFDGFLKSALERVRYFSDFNEKKLRQRIISDAYGFIAEVIAKD